MTDKKRKPLLPARLALDTRTEIKGFIEALLYARKTDAAQEIINTLFTSDPMIQGPFINLSRPYIRSTDTKWPLDPKLKPEPRFTPYAHQIEAFKRLRLDLEKSQLPQHTIITTGTGSGKSECFLLPILDYVLQCKNSESNKKSGIKALIIYPMNALIDDQAERLGKLANQIHADIRIGRYTGDKGKVKKMSASDPKKIIDDRETLCDDPPDILLTNYRMLDFMLFRPEEQKMWGDVTKNVFQYLVLDELHTFDGAQGADVSCLIRRFRMKLHKEFTCVGTSATVAGNNSTEDGLKSLCNFASTLFGVNFEISDIIREQRVEINNFLQPIEERNIPKLRSKEENQELLQTLHLHENGYEAYLEKISKDWSAPTDSVERSEWVLSHPLFHELLTTDILGKSLQEIVKDSKFKDLSEDLLCEFLDLVATSRRKGGSPLLPLSIQLWASETKYLLRKLSAKPEFIRGGASTNEEKIGYLPAVHCRRCGFSGWTANLSEVGEQCRISWNIAQNIEAFFSESSWILFPSASQNPTLLEKNSELPMDRLYFNPETDEIKILPKAPEENGEWIAFVGIEQEKAKHYFLKKSKFKNKKEKNRCPDCDSALSLALTSVGGSMLGSVLSSTFITNPANPDDKKLLMFNDSVQDAAHQAGYIGARSYRFNIRRYLEKIIHELMDSDQGTTIEKILTEIKININLLWNNSIQDSEEARSARADLVHLIPKDLWERWKVEGDENPLRNVSSFRNQLIERIQWEAWMELTIHSDLGWSLSKSGHGILKLTDSAFQEWKNAVAVNAMKAGLGSFENLDAFVEGLSSRIIQLGAVYHDSLEVCYKASQYNLWPLLAKKSYLRNIFHNNGVFPQLIALKKPDSPKKSSITPLTSKGRNWFKLWLKKCLIHNADGENITELSTDKILAFMKGLLETLANTPLGLKNVSDAALTDVDHLKVVIPQAALKVISLKNNTEEIMAVCDTCHGVSLWNLKSFQHRISCTNYLCHGNLNKDPNTLGKNFDIFRKYLHKQYQKPVHGIFPHSHTGALDGDDRRRIETAFKEGLYPGDKITSRKEYTDHPVNILTCTPTLEMGIDIGSLSGVVLRGFPRSLASTLQRVGRSGRTSGNSFNVILATRKPHDQYHWQDPKIIFKGSVTPPGCEFRTREILLRQFHAFLLDSYGSIAESAAIPKPMDGYKLEEHDYWSGFKKFLSGDLSKFILQFCIEVGKSDTRPDHDKEKQIFYADLQLLLDSTLKGRKSLWKRIAEVLEEQDNLIKENLSTTVENNEKEEGLEKISSPKDEAMLPFTEAPTEQIKKSQLKSKEDPRYTLKLLADRGILPNYAFTEEGVTLVSSVWRRCDPSESSKNSSKTFERKTFSVEVSDFSRPSPNALLEFAPGQSFYADGLKIPITRIELKSEDLKNRKIICSECGVISERCTEDDSQKEKCPSCDHSEQDVAYICDISQVHGSGDFDDLQIRDQDESRDKQTFHIETMINFAAKQDYDIASLNATWASPTAEVCFEFRTNAPIQFLVRGEKVGSSGYSYFNVCRGCGAVPYKSEANHYQFTRGGFNNRHSRECEHAKAGDIPEEKTVKIALGRMIRSDAIRFLVVDFDSLASINAVLRLALQVRLGGSPQHLAIRNHFLQGSEDQKITVVTLYDTVPGGTGHLRGLMPSFGENQASELSGIESLRDMFQKTFDKITQCKCENGCYECLLSYENQFQHNKISKIVAQDWLRKFLDCSDWRQKKEALTGVELRGIYEDSALEQSFKHHLCLKTETIPGLPFREVGIKEMQWVMALGTKKDFCTLEIRHTPSEKVELKNGGYTKPDFTLFSNDKIIGYIYCDGAGPHLSPAEDVPTFQKDVFLRSKLYSQMDSRNILSPVLTFTSDMIKDWATWNKERVEGEDLSKTLRSMLWKNFEVENEKQTPSIHVLTHLLWELFKDQGSKSISPYRSISELQRNLYRGFVSCGMAQIFKSEPIFITEKDIKNTKDVCNRIKNTKSYGGLTFVPKGANHEFSFIMSVDLEKRSKDGKIDEEYKKSWELFWILWAVLPGMVSLEEEK